MIENQTELLWKLIIDEKTYTSEDLKNKKREEGSWA